MSLVAKLIGFGFRQVIGAGAGQTAEIVVGAVEQHFIDHSQTLPKALAKVTDRAGSQESPCRTRRHSWPRCLQSTLGRRKLSRCKVSGGDSSHALRRVPFSGPL